MYELRQVLDLELGEVESRTGHEPDRPQPGARRGSLQTGALGSRPGADRRVDRDRPPAERRQQPPRNVVEHGGRDDRRPGSIASTTIGGSSSSASSSAITYSISAAASRDASEPCARFSRLQRERDLVELLAHVVERPRDRASRARRLTTDTAYSRPSSAAWASSCRSPSIASAAPSSSRTAAPEAASPRTVRDRRRMSRSTRARARSASCALLVGRRRVGDRRVEAAQLGEHRRHLGVVGRAHVRYAMTALPRSAPAALVAGRPRPPAARRAPSARSRVRPRARASRSSRARLGRHRDAQATRSSAARCLSVTPLTCDESVDVREQDLVGRPALARRRGALRAAQDRSHR